MSVTQETEMTIRLAAPETEVETAPFKQQCGVTFEADSRGARPSEQAIQPDLHTEEYRFIYLPTMVGVYTARHQKMPTSDESLHEHVFGTVRYAGCQACREETEFLVAHQKKFF